MMSAPIRKICLALPCLSLLIGSGIVGHQYYRLSTLKTTLQHAEASVKRLSPMAVKLNPGETSSTHVHTDQCEHDH